MRSHIQTWYALPSDTRFLLISMLAAPTRSKIIVHIIPGLALSFTPKTYLFSSLFAYRRQHLVSRSELSFSPTWLVMVPHTFLLPLQLPFLHTSINAFRPSAQQRHRAPHYCAKHSFTSNSLFRSLLRFAPLQQTLYVKIRTRVFQHKRSLYPLTPQQLIKANQPTKQKKKLFFLLPAYG
jgi:hypothetical protein